MKALILVAALVLLTQVANASTANYGDLQYALTVNDQRSFNISSDAGQLTSGCLVFVYDAGTKTLSTIYADRKRTARVNPISRAQFATDQQILFYGPSASYDVFVAHVDGSTASYPGITSLQHRLSLDRASNRKTIIIPWTTPGAVETDSGVDLPKNSVVTDVVVEVVTAESAKTLDVGLLSTGTGGDANGFIEAISTTTAGYPETRSISAGSSESYLWAYTLGVLLGKFRVGTDTAGREGQATVLGYPVSGSNTTRVSYTGSSGATTGAGYIYFLLQLLR